MKILSQLHTNRTRPCRHTKVYLNEMVVRFEDHEDLQSSQAFNVTTITNSDVCWSCGIKLRSAQGIRYVVFDVRHCKLHLPGNTEIRPKPSMIYNPLLKNRTNLNNA
jgi:hypothetical protein